MKVKLYVRQDIGSGKPIVLLHGIFADGSQWNKISQLLKKNQRVIVVDVLGHGKSPKPEGALYNAKEHAEALRNALVEINATKNLTVVGYSMGGAVALSYAARYPEDIEQLYLISTPFYLSSDRMIALDYTNSLIFTKVSLALFRFLDSILTNNRLTEKALAYANDSNQFHKMIGSDDNELDSIVVRRNLKEMIWDFDFAGNLEKVTAPTTIYAGKKDLFIVQGQLYALKQIKPNADIQRLDVIKVDHMLVQNLPKETVKLITRNQEQLLYINTDKGSGSVIVLLHGIESSSTYWNNLVPALSEKHRVVAIDLLGFGKSPKPLNIAYSLDDQVKVLHQTLIDAGITKFALVGHSLGSIVALAYSAKYPQEITQLTLLSPVVISETTKSNQDILKRLNLIDNISDTSFMLSQAALAVGDKRIRRFLPFVRSLQNSIGTQNAPVLAKQASSVPTTMVYGQNDPLIDKELLKTMASSFDTCSVEEVPSGFHNFPLFKPSVAINAILPGFKPSKKLSSTSMLPKTFLKQIVRLSAPILAGKSLLYIIVGVLLFTDFAPYILVTGLIVFVVAKGLDIIKGAFTLKNEGVSYISYIVLGLAIGLAAFFLFRHPEASLRITALIISVMIILTGSIRIIVALRWTKSRKLRLALLTTGSALTLAGIGVLLGNITSAYVVVYGIAIYLIFRGIQFGIYATGSVTMAYIRGFNK